MRKTVSFLFVGLYFIAPTFAELKFIEGDLRIAKEKAAREGKLILLDFWASYCTPCRMMEEYTFSNSEVEEYIKANYIPVKVDIQSFDGYDLKNQFKVSVLPTIIVLSSKGSQVGRHEETFSASRLIPVLSMYNLPKNRLKSSVLKPLSYDDVAATNNNIKTRVSTTPSTASRNSATSNIQINPVNNRVNQEELSNKITVPTKPTPAKVPNPIAPSVNPSALAIEGATFTTAQSNTYTIQIAAYFSEEQLKEAMPDVKRDFENKQKIFISRRKENGKTIFRVLIGKFDNRQLADKYLKSIGVDGIVKNFDALK